MNANAFADFQKLCVEVNTSTKFLIFHEQCVPHYQRVLDFIRSHPNLRDKFAVALAAGLAEEVVRVPESERVGVSIYLLQFLMKELRWPEIKTAAEYRFGDGGNAWRAKEIENLLRVYQQG